MANRRAAWDHKMLLKSLLPVETRPINNEVYESVASHSNMKPFVYDMGHNWSGMV